MCTSCTDTVPFFPYEWVDDHTMVEPDLPDRCRTAEDALCLAMLEVLGPTSINEDKFTSWSTTTIALGLEWDTVAGTVSIPVENIDKALARVRTLEDQRRVSKHELECLLDSLRHVVSCLHAARPFYQRLHKLARCAPRFGCVLIKEDVRDDLRWFSSILKPGTLRGVRTRLFDRRLPQPDVHYYMDANKYAACMLDLARKLFMIIIFDEDERKLMTVKDATTTFDINVREQLCIAIAAVVFSPTWARLLSPRCIWLDTGAGPEQPPLYIQGLLCDLQAASLARSSRVTHERTWRQWCTWRAS
ncbi:hypothetical protein PI124_g23493 [Phytophthora idaei]|nr:hypothetical protein PI125_g25585 [Phytophthora idaei]KAG3123864.1 hypothetical protein PI126_g23510 [Phytophthora idaei]KAG3231411.1 hypothetical protein PI124_g23493 [Phytophthora idaei]